MGGIRSLYYSPALYRFSLFSKNVQTPFSRCSNSRNKLDVATCRSQFPLHCAPPSAAGLAAFSVPHTSFSFSGIVTRFGPLPDASATRLLTASERIAAFGWRLDQERGG
ncbi:hypothetical protein COCVIDRAFT_115073 [Bipolaris victoriae FI3]|uniref:Uncharacterized protein n=2 Tax=Bipolaris TaxID=33194 RepID=W6XYS7_COCC2|nr:uncharacterized protein COCCADRAFT_110602 [Bipolaris zeicola 26-R-13]XP_014550590.1 hypothetical protein COCVIDRAFT_115073 [Bipolaris victoriae FI3]EUC27869.1 hypothetical protein COCCADRAFT_110602 [Bipolaris zeicola 26-R-13]